MNEIKELSIENEQDWKGKGNAFPPPPDIEATPWHKSEVPSRFKPLTVPVLKKHVGHVIQFHPENDTFSFLNPVLFKLTYGLLGFMAGVIFGATVVALAVL